MKIICIECTHNNPFSLEPIFFLKPETALIRGNKPFFYPNFSTNITYSISLVYRICRVGRHISERFAHRYYDAVGIGIEFTASDILQNCQQNGLPWEKAKSFDGSTVISNNFIPIEQLVDKEKITFQLVKNDKTVQQYESDKMFFSIDKIIGDISRFLMLKIGDLIFTGTPTNSEKIEKGDVLKASVFGKMMLEIKVC